MSRFPPIADYAFLSDCEVNALVAPDGAVEWLCLPRPDSPSVFGAMLDRSAGFFHFGPSTSMYPISGDTCRGRTCWRRRGTRQRLDDGPRSARDRAVRRTTSAIGLATGAERRRAGSRTRCCASRRASTGGSSSRRTACRCSTTARTGTWEYDGAGYDKRHRRRAETRHSSRRSSMRLGTMAPGHTGARRSDDGETRGSRCRGGDRCPR